MKIMISLIALLATLGSSAVIWTYTEADNSGNNIALGYPVPTPVDSLLPVDGFRAYDFLHTRHQDLAVVSDNIVATSIGQTLNGETIWAYVISDPDSTSEPNVPEAAMLQNGGIHAREWQSPEVVTAIMERLYDNENDQGYYQYLIENNQMVIIPVLNIDGFRQTQNYPTQVMQSTFPSDPSSWPRDGRMRRKNMLDTDSDLNTESDNLRGVDLNRNNNPYWATNSSRSSSDSRSLVHHGSGPASEPETQALQAAAALVNASQLRLYIDTHSFTQIYFTPLTENDRRNALTEFLVNRMRAVNNFRYDYGPSNAGSGIGTTTEYFANTYQIPAYTLETEPTSNGASDYGGFGVSHDGFILPETEIDRVRNELTNATLFGYYVQSGPPSMLSVSILEVASNTLVYEGRWTATSAATRTWQEVVSSGLMNDTNYRMRIQFNKPMRWRNNGVISNFPGNSVTLMPQIIVEGKDSSGNVFSVSLDTSNGHWQDSTIDNFESFARYKDDTFITDFSIANNLANLSNAQLLQVAIQTTDMSGQSLDANPASVVSWSNGAWSGYESSDGSHGDTGGVDRTTRLINDGSPAFTSPSNNSRSSGGGSFEIYFLVLTLMLYIFNELLNRRCNETGR